jgi:hypothetical protein
MTDISAFPTIQKVLSEGDNIHGFTAGEAITAGQVVGIAATGVSNTIVRMNDTSGENAIGVALYDTDSGDECLVACVGCIVYVANADDTTAIDAGGFVEQNDNAVLGTVSEFAPRANLASTTIDASDDTTVDGDARIVGIAIEDIAGGGTGRIIVQPQLILYSDHTVV